MIFGGMLFPESIRENIGETILHVQNMLCSFLLFQHKSKRTKVLVAVIILLVLIARLNQEFMQQQIPFLFASMYLIYFAQISFRLFRDIKAQAVVRLETISAAFCGFILLGVFASIVFISLDAILDGAFSGIPERNFSDFLYFSFITLLTIGYGDIAPTMEISKKLVILVGLLGHFYTVFVMAIIVGKYLSKNQND
ncbi:MAG: potassium channel family protein [Bacteroidota bacterium]